MLLAIAVAVLALLIATLLPFSSGRAWWIRDFDFPRLQIAVIAVVLFAAEIGWLLPGGRWEWLLIVLTVGCLACQAWWIIPYTPLYRKEVRGAGSVAAEQTLRVLSANVLMDNHNARLLLNQVVRHQPDVFVTLESDRWWQRQLDVLEPDYPHTLKCPLDNRYGMHVYSRLPMIDPQIRFLLADDIPSMHFTVRLADGSEVALHCVHPTPPSPTENPESGPRDAELILVGRAVAGSSAPVIVTGDLNDVAWSSTTRLFRKISGLLDPRVGRGMFNTFHAEYPFLRWPLDHLFHSDHFGLVKMQRLGKTGSDHFPILVELALRPELSGRQEGLESDSDDHRRARETIAEQAVTQQDG